MTALLLLLLAAAAWLMLHAAKHRAVELLMPVAVLGSSSPAAGSVVAALIARCWGVRRARPRPIVGVEGCSYCLTHSPMMMAAATDVEAAAPAPMAAGGPIPVAAAAVPVARVAGGVRPEP